MSPLRKEAVCYYPLLDWCCRFQYVHCVWCLNVGTIFICVTQLVYPKDHNSHTNDYYVNLNHFDLTYSWFTSRRHDVLALSSHVLARQALLLSQIPRHNTSTIIGKLVTSLSHFTNIHARVHTHTHSFIHTWIHICYTFDS